jgi:hypothetical protein
MRASVYNSSIPDHEGRDREWMRRSEVLEIDVYRHLLSINAGFNLVLRGLTALRKHAAFHRDELARFAALSKENRSATNSYLLGAIEIAETNEAGRRFRKRLAQQRADEQGK